MTKELRWGETQLTKEKTPWTEADTKSLLHIVYSGKQLEMNE